MNRFVAWTLAAVVVATCSLAGTLPSAKAIPNFKKEFDAKYVKKDGNDAEKAFAAKVDKVKCNVCHKGKNKKERNEYGDVLAEMLDKKADEKDQAKIQASLDKAFDMKSKADPSKSYGDLIKAGQLPGGEEEAK